MEDATNLILAAIDRVDKRVSEIGSEVHEQGKQIAKLEVNQENLKEDLTGIKSSVDKIHEVDIEQTKSLDEHIKRTEMLEDKMETFEEHQEEFVEIIKSLRPSDTEMAKEKFSFLKELIKSKPFLIISACVGIILIFLFTGQKIDITQIFGK